jgi:hypothetical protein
VGTISLTNIQQCQRFERGEMARSHLNGYQDPAIPPAIAVSFTGFPSYLATLLQSRPAHAIIQFPHFDLFY